MKKAVFVTAVPSKINGTRSSNEHNRTKSWGAPKVAMRRKLVWIEEQHFRGWGCSECAWMFNPSGSPTGKSLDEMKQNYEQQRDKEFTSHVCAEHPRATKKPR
jgi:hypothetical protein